MVQQTIRDVVTGLRRLQSLVNVGLSDFAFRKARRDGPSSERVEAGRRLSSQVEQ
jgi:hypothetical protein